MPTMDRRVALEVNGHYLGALRSGADVAVVKPDEDRRRTLYCTLRIRL